MQVQLNKASGGLCPHGLPPGACPICSGGGGMQSSRVDYRHKPGEMSWAQCAAIGAMLRAQRLRKEQAAEAYENRQIQLAKFQNNMMALSQRLALIAVRAQSLPAIIAKPINVLLNKVLIPVTNFIKNFPQTVMNFTNKMFNKLVDIQDKLNAMFGELKNSIEKKISDKLKEYKKKVSSLFSLFEPQEVDEEKVVDDTKGVFEARTFIHDVYNKITETFQSYDKMKQVEKDENSSS